MSALSTSICDMFDTLLTLLPIHQKPGGLVMDAHSSAILQLTTLNHQAALWEGRLTSWFAQTLFHRAHGAWMTCAVLRTGHVKLWFGTTLQAFKLQESTGRTASTIVQKRRTHVCGIAHLPVHLDMVDDGRSGLGIPRPHPLHVRCGRRRMTT